MIIHMIPMFGGAQHLLSSEASEFRNGIDELPSTVILQLGNGEKKDPWNFNHERESVLARPGSALIPPLSRLVGRLQGANCSWPLGHHCIWSKANGRGDRGHHRTQAGNNECGLTHILHPTYYYLIQQKQGGFQKE